MSKQKKYNVTCPACNRRLALTNCRTCKCGADVRHDQATGLVTIFERKKEQK